MQLREEKKDLFTVPSDYILMHCISSDFALGAGIAKTFKEKGVREALFQKYLPNTWIGRGYSLYTPMQGYRGAFNLVTKQRYWHKPTYDAVAEALQTVHYYLAHEMDMKNETVKLAMPYIGCGLDRLEWPKVKELVMKEFEGEDIDILVCKNE